MYWLEYNKEKLESIINPEWILIYATIPHINKEILSDLTDKFPDTHIFGTTSYLGVFTPEGFKKGCFLLISEPHDKIKVFPVIKVCNEINASEMAREASKIILKSLGQKPDQILIHSTPGFEESILEGIESVFNSEVPVHGGSAADNLMKGEWFVFNNKKIVNKGFILVGIVNENKIYSSFVSGYLPKGSKGFITSADGRRVFEIENRPAAEVYNEWSEGILDGLMEEDNRILGNTTLKPIAKIINKNDKNMYLIAHPHYFNKEDKSLQFLCEFKNGDEITMTHGSSQTLFKKIEEVVQSTNVVDKSALKGGILIYCAGCVGMNHENGDKVSRSFSDNTNNIPFLGISTFGEQGSFKNEQKNLNLHGNLMSCAILF